MFISLVNEFNGNTNLMDYTYQNSNIISVQFITPLIGHTMTSEERQICEEEVENELTESKQILNREYNLEILNV